MSRQRRNGPAAGGMGAGIAIGTGTGTALGLAVGNLALGAAIGAAMGVPLGLVLSRAGANGPRGRAGLWLTLGLGVALFLLASAILVR